MIDYLIGLIAVVALVLSIICMTRCKTDKFGEGDNYQSERQLNSKLSCAEQAGHTWWYNNKFGIDMLGGTCIGEYVEPENKHLSCASKSMTSPLKIANNSKKHTGKEGKVAYDCEMTRNVQLVSDDWCDQGRNKSILMDEDWKFANMVNNPITITGKCYGVSVTTENVEYSCERTQELNQRGLNFDTVQGHSRKAGIGEAQLCEVSI